MNVSAANWADYWKAIVSFRDTFVAHRDLEPLSPVPVLDRALEAALFYDDWIRRVIAPDTLDEKPARELVTTLQQVVADDVEKAVRPFARVP